MSLQHTSQHSPYRLAAQRTTSWPYNSSSQPAYDCTAAFTAYCYGVRWRHCGCLHLLQNHQVAWLSAATATAVGAHAALVPSLLLACAAQLPQPRCPQLRWHHCCRIRVQWPPPGAQLSTAADTMRTTVPATSARCLAALRQESAALRQAPQAHFC